MYVKVIVMNLFTRYVDIYSHTLEVQGNMHAESFKKHGATNRLGQSLIVCNLKCTMSL